MIDKSIWISYICFLTSCAYRVVWNILITFFQMHVLQKPTTEIQYSCHKIHVWVFILMSEHVRRLINQHLPSPGVGACGSNGWSNSGSVYQISCDITAVFGLLPLARLPKCQLTKNHIVFGQTEAWSRANTRYPSTQYDWVAQGSMELRSLLDASTHDMQWELNPRPFDLESKALSIRPNAHKNVVLKLSTLEIMSIIVSACYNIVWWIKIHHAFKWPGCWGKLSKLTYLFPPSSSVTGVRYFAAAS